jgi:8-oxo-dGTP diphosphatase
MDIVQRIAMKAVILNNEGEALILREAGNSYQEGTNEGKWQFPGGRINPGENWLDGLNREVFEETGLSVEWVKPIHIGEWRPIIKGQQNQIVAVFNLCRYKSGELKLSEEHDKHAWVGASDVDNYNLLESEVQILKLVFKKA